MLLGATTPQKGQLWAATRAPQEQPNRPYLTSRTVYQVLVRQSKARLRAVMLGGRRGHIRAECGA